MKRIVIFFALIVGVMSAQTPADSVTITFRAHKGTETPVSLPGQFSGWSTSNMMSYDTTIAAWTKTYTFKIHDPSRTPLGDSVYQYKLNDGNWYSDPLNPEQNPNDNNNSVLRLSKFFFFQFYAEEASSNISRIVAGIVHANSDTVASVKFYTGASQVSATMTDITSAFIVDKRILNFPLPVPVPKSNYLRVVATNNNGDSIVYQNTVVDVQSRPLPAYAKHGVTKASAQSGDSTTFRLRVPGKSFVLLRIAPSGQPVATATPIVMHKDSSSDNWWVNVMLQPETEYEYLYEIENGIKITDPFGRYVGLYGTQFSTGAAGLAADDYLWQSTDWDRPPLNKLVVYELHVGEFAGGYYNKSAGQAGFSDLKSLLSHFKVLGVNAIELMPVNDYGTVGKSGHSWGYDLNSYFAIEPALGTPLELKQLVDAAHQQGIAVILDVVYNHLNDTGPLWQMAPDVVSNPYFKANEDLRYNEDGLYFFKDVDHWTSETQEMILENLKMWIDEYKIDGFRYDFTQGIGWNTAETNKGILGWTNAIHNLYQGAIYQIAEHLPESPALIYYSGLTGGWHDSFRDEIFDDARFQNTSMLDYENLVLGLGAYGSNDTPNSPSSYANRTEPVNATITHDEQSLIYEMTQFQSVPVSEAVQRDKLYGAFPFLSLGIPMLWMGQEISAPRGWTSDGQKLSYRPLDWDWMLVQRGIDHFQWYKTLVNHRLKNPALFQGELKKLYRYESSKVLVWGFEDTTTNSKVMCVANLHPFNQTPSNVPWLGEGNWYDIFDQSVFAVSGTSVASFPINAFTIKVYSNRSNTELGITSANRQTAAVPEEFGLSNNYPNPFNPATTIAYRIPAASHVSLKVYDLLGKEVTVLMDGIQTAGYYSTVFDASQLSSGTYFYRLIAGRYSEVKRMSLVK